MREGVMILMEILTVGLGELPEERIERNRINFAGNIKGKNENSVKKRCACVLLSG